MAPPYSSFQSSIFAKLSICGTGPQQIAPRLQRDDILLLFSLTEEILALRCANNRLYIIGFDEDTKIDIDESSI